MKQGSKRNHNDENRKKLEKIERAKKQGLEARVMTAEEFFGKKQLQSNVSKDEKSLISTNNETGEKKSNLKILEKNEKQLKKQVSFDQPTIEKAEKKEKEAPKKIKEAPKPISLFRQRMLDKQNGF